MPSVADNLTMIYEHMRSHNLTVDVIEKKDAWIQFHTFANKLPIVGRVQLSFNNNAVKLQIVLMTAAGTEAHKDTICHLNALINERIHQGRFGIYLTDGQINYKDHLYLEDGRLTEKMLYSLIGMGIITVHEYIFCFMGVLEQGLSVEKALTLYKEMEVTRS